MIVAFRVDSSSLMGAGHLNRCLSLAKALREYAVECVFVSRDHKGNLVSAVRENGFEAKLLPAEGPESAANRSPVMSYSAGASWQHDAEQTKAALKNYAVDWLIVDHYGLDQEWEHSLRELGGKLLVIDDIADRRHDCDLLLDQNIPDKTQAYSALVPSTCRIISGPQFALLDPSYAEICGQVSERRGMVRRALVYFGGGCHSDLVRLALEAIVELRPNVLVDVVIGQADPSDLASSTYTNVRFHSNLPTLAMLMARADLAIGASGSSSWERCCLGLPSVVVTVAENQKATAEELARLGVVVNLGNTDEVTREKFSTALKPLLTEELDHTWSARCRALVDGHGADRVARVMFMGSLRV